MPELPEVEAARRALEEHCVGKVIRRCSVADDPKVIDGGISPSVFEAALVGKTIVAALRKGKNMWLQLDSPPYPSFQFGMAGAIYIKGVAVTKYKRSIVKDDEDWPSKYSKVFVELEDGLEFSFTDKRRFAKVRLLDNPASVPPISELGPDTLLEPMSVDEFVQSLCKKKLPIKALLLDQNYISGIGNWIADEVLYQARIHPLQPAATLSRMECEELHKSINQVIGKAVEVGGDNNEYPSNWIFHFREKKPGKAIVDGKKIEFITAGGRTSAFVPELQKLSGATSKTARTKKLKEHLDTDDHEVAENISSDQEASEHLDTDDHEVAENISSDQKASRKKKQSSGKQTGKQTVKLDSERKTTARQRTTMEKKIEEPKKSKLGLRAAKGRQAKSKSRKDEEDAIVIPLEDGSSSAARKPHAKRARK